MFDIFDRWKEEPFDEMDSTLAVQQYIQQTIRKDPKGDNSGSIRFLILLYENIIIN